MVERRARVADWREFKSRIIGGGGGIIESEKDSLQWRLTGLRSIRQLFGIVPKSGNNAFPGTQ